MPLLPFEAEMKDTNTLILQWMLHLIAVFQTGDTRCSYCFDFRESFK